MSWRTDPGDGDDDLDRCDGYVLLIADPVSECVDCYGPYRSLATARAGLADTRERLDADELDDVIVTLARWHSP